MSEGVSKWRSVATSTTASRFSSFKNYLQQDLKNSLPQSIQRQIDNAKAGSWREWAGQKISGSNNNVPGIERVALFPSWATRKYQQKKRDVGDAFEVDVYVSGFATVHRAPELASRSQKAFMRLAKGYAALPKLDGQQDDQNEVMMSTHLTPSTEDLLQSVKLPPRPTEATEDYEVEALERHFQRLSTNFEESPQPSPQSSIVHLSPEEPSTSRRSAQEDFRNPINSVSDELRKLHANLEARLLPFWSSVLPGRIIRIHIFASHKHPSNSSGPASRDADPDREAIENGPIATQDVITAADGSFQARFRIAWEEMCYHESFLHIAFGDPSEEHDLLITAQVLPPSPQSSASSSTSDLRNYNSGREPSPGIPDPPPPTTMHISLTHAPLRVISDIDDTVKLSNISAGARTVFHNVFVKELRDLVISGMGEWYSEMWKKGVRFHYVSNGPFELLPVIGEFFKIANLPPGSIKLRSYAGKSLFSGLLSAPAVRKRAGVLEIMDAFPDSKFILVGDSGEQDLELYSELTRDKPSQILAVFIRDTLSGKPLDDPTGEAFGLGYFGSDDISYTPPSSSIGSGYGPRRRVTDPEGTITPKSSLTPVTPINTSISSALNSNANSNPYSTSYAVRAPQTPKKTPSSAPLTNYFSSMVVSAEPEAVTPMSAGAVPYYSNYSNQRHNAYPPPSPYGIGKKSPKSSLSLSLPPGQSSAAIPNSSSASFKRPSKAGSIGSVYFASDGNDAKMMEMERKRYDLQVRVWNARSVMPEKIVLRVFRDPGECRTETGRLLESLGW